MTESGSLPLRNDAKLKSTYDFAISRHVAPEALLVSLAQRGRGECRMPNAPAVSCAMIVVERTRVTTSTPESPGIPARNGFNGFLRALLGDRALLPPSSADMFCLSPVGPTQLRELDASVGASGPHDFAVRCNRLSSARLVITHRLIARPAIPSRARRCRVHRIPAQRL
jgi:hypothetical protein